MLHRLGTDEGEDAEIFAEPDPAWFIGVSGALTGRTAMIDVHGHDGSETLIVDLDAPTAPAAPRRAAPAGSFLRRARPRRTPLHPHQRRRPRLQDRRGAARRSRRGELARGRRPPRRLLSRRCRGSCRLARSAGARGEPPAPDRPRPRDRRAPRRRLRRGDLRARFRHDLRVRLAAHPFLLFVDGAAGGDLRL